MDDQLTKKNEVLFLAEFNTFQTQDDIKLRESILSGFHLKLIELYQREHPEENFDPKSITYDDLEVFYQTEKNNHRGLDLVTYSNMKTLSCFCESDILLTNLKELIAICLKQDDLECLPLKLYRYYFLSLVFKLSGIVQRLSDYGLSSEALTIKSACGEQINKISKNDILSKAFLSEVDNDLPSEVKETQYDLNFSAIQLKKRDDKNV